MACFAASPKSRDGAAQTVGLVTALYRGRAHETLASRLEALGIATDFQAGVLLSKWIEGDEIDVEALKASLRKSVIAIKVFPVVLGTAFKNKGVQPLLDAVIDFLPSPLS